MILEDSHYRVHGLQVVPEGIEISYLRLKDIKENGVVFRRVVLVPFGADYDDELERLAEAIETVIADVEDDESVLEPFQPGDGDDDDEEED